MAFCPSCGKELEPGAGGCPACAGGDPSESLGTTRPFERDNDMTDDPRTTQPESGVLPAAEPGIGDDQDTTPHLPALDGEIKEAALPAAGAESPFDAAVDSVPPSGRQLSVSSREVTSPPVEGAEPADSLLSTVINDPPPGLDPPPDNLAATVLEAPQNEIPAAEGLGDLLIDRPHPAAGEQPRRSEHEPGTLQDTLVEVESIDQEPAEDDFSPADITFSVLKTELGRDDETGAAPLNAIEFKKPDDGHHKPIPDLNSSGGLARQLEDIDGAADAGGAPAPGGALARINQLACALAALAWIAVSVALLGPLLGVTLLSPALEVLPVIPEAMPAAPGALTLLCIFLAAGVRRRADAQNVSYAGASLGLLAWFVVAALPGVGLLAGLVASIVYLARHRPGTTAAGLLLLVYTLAWQACAAALSRSYWIEYVTRGS